MAPTADHPHLQRTVVQVLQRMVAREELAAPMGELLPLSVEAMGGRHQLPMGARLRWQGVAAMGGLQLQIMAVMGGLQLQTVAVMGGLQLQTVAAMGDPPLQTVAAMGGLRPHTVPVADMGDLRRQISAVMGESKSTVVTAGPQHLVAAVMAGEQHLVVVVVVVDMAEVVVTGPLLHSMGRQDVVAAMARLQAAPIVSRGPWLATRPLPASCPSTRSTHTRTAGRSRHG